MLQDADFQKISTITQHTVLLGHLQPLTRNTCCFAFLPGTRMHLVIAQQRYMDAAGLSPAYSHYFYCENEEHDHLPRVFGKKLGKMHKLSSLLPQRRCFQTTSMCSGLHLWALSVFQHLAHGFGTEIKKEDSQCLKLFVIPRLISFPPLEKT